MDPNGRFVPGRSDVSGRCRRLTWSRSWRSSFSVAEKNGWTRDDLVQHLATSWPDILDASTPPRGDTQTTSIRTEDWWVPDAAAPLRELLPSCARARSTARLPAGVRPGGRAGAAARQYRSWASDGVVMTLHRGNDQVTLSPPVEGALPGRDASEAAADGQQRLTSDSVSGMGRGVS